MRGYPHFSFWIPITLAKICFFPIVPSVLGGTALNWIAIKGPNATVRETTNPETRAMSLMLRLGNS